MRLDGAKPVRGLDRLRQFLPVVMPTRSAAVLYFQWPVEIAAIDAWLAQVNQGRRHPYRLFHLVIAATVRTLAERPQLNRYVLGSRLYDRPYISITFSVKQGKRDDAGIVSTKVMFDPTDDLEQVRSKVDSAVALARDPDRVGTVERELRILTAMPAIMARGLLRSLTVLEGWGLVPSSLLDTDPMHTSAFIANLGSIGLDASFHHLSDSGTASLHATLGKIKQMVVPGPHGEPAVVRGFELKIAVDDRICDGLYCANSLNLLGHWLTHPVALATPTPDRPDLIPGRLWAWADREPESVAYRIRAGDGRWYGATWATYRAEARSVGLALIKHGVQAGERVCLQGANRSEWATFYLGAMAIGAVPCGLHEDLTPGELHDLLALARPKVVLLDTLGPASQIRATLPDVVLVLIPRRGDATRTDDPGIHWEDWLADGLNGDDGEVERRLANIQPDDPAALVFTSGTTGRARGVVLTHRNLAWTATAASDVLGAGSDDTTISYLPLSHVAEQNFTITVAVTTGATIAFAPSRGAIFQTLIELRPTVFFGVPQIWARLRRQAEELDGSDILKQLGLDKVRLAISGAARLDPELQAYFAGLGLPLIETYGQSEGCGPTTMTRPDDVRKGTVGPPLPGVDVKIADDGEILVRGPIVFAGYFEDEEATAEVLRDGWLYSGDLGEWDGSHLKVVGRKKDLVVTRGGENVAPAPLESALQALPLVGRAVVVGNGRPHLAALIDLDVEAAVRLLGDCAPTVGVRQHDKVLKQLDRGLRFLNSTLSRTEQIRSIKVLPRALSLDEGELTATLKVRRAVVVDRWSETIEALYNEAAARPVLPPVRTRGFQVRPATVSELDAVYALRFEVFNDKGHVDPGRWPGGRMVDRFDPKALQFALWDADGELAGCARLVRPGAIGLPVYDLFDFERVDVADERIGEVGRLAISAKWRGRRAPVVALIRGCMDTARALGITHVYAFVPKHTVRGYGTLGLPVWERTLQQPTPQTLSNREPMAGYFETQDPRVVVFTEPAA